MLWTAAWYVPAFLLVVAAAAGMGALLDRWRPPNTDPVMTSRDSIVEAQRLFSTMDHARLARAVAQLDAVPWDTTDPSIQKITADLLATARTFAVAHETAAPAGGAALLDLAADSVERMAAAAETAADERRRLNEGDARTMAGYLAARYSSADTAPPL